LKKGEKNNDQRNLLIILLTVIAVAIFIFLSSGAIKLPSFGKSKSNISLKVDPSSKIDYKSMGKPEITEEDKDPNRKFSGKEQLLMNEYSKLKAYLMEEGMKLDLTLDEYIIDYDTTKLSDEDFFASYYEKYDKKLEEIEKEKEKEGQVSEGKTESGTETTGVVDEEEDLERTELRFKYGLSEDELGILMSGHKNLLDKAKSAGIAYDKSLEDYLNDFKNEKKSLIGLDKATQFNQNVLTSLGLD